MLTPRQKQIFEYIKQYIKRKGCSPSLEEVGRRFKLAKSTIHQHVETLRERGYLNKFNYRARSIEILENKKLSDLVEIPLLGTITAGEPIETYQIPEKIEVPKNLLAKRGENFALKVNGDSMIDEGIFDGDTVIIKRQQTAENGESVVALINDSETTLKKIYREKGGFRLQPANPNLKPIFTKELTIQGKVISVIRNFEELKEIEIVEIPQKIEKYPKLPVNQIICGDAVEELQKLPDGSVDLIITDPPYGISRELNCKGQRLGTTARLNFNFGAWDTFNKEWFDIALKKTRGWMMTFCAKKDVGFFIDGLEKNGFIAIDVLVWQKPDPIPLNAKSRFLNAWEAMVIGKKPGAIWNSNYEHNIIKVQAPKGKNRIHPTQKPVELIKKLINLTTMEGDIILDPFMGSGTTAVACLEAKRNYIGFEISKQYWKQSLERIENLPKKLF